MRTLKMNCRKLIRFTQRVLTDLENPILQEHYSAKHDGVCSVYLWEAGVRVLPLVRMYNEEMKSTLKLLGKDLPITHISVPNAYLITIPPKRFNEASGMDAGFKGELLERRRHFLEFILAKLREAEAYFNNEHNSVQKEVLEWLQGVQIRSK